jgi:N-acetylmuramoyl-L-alanine amidase
MSQLIINGHAVSWTPTPNIVDRKKDIQVIVLHSTEGRLNGALSTLTNGNSAKKVSAHYLIGRDGSIIQMAQTNDVTWHAGSAVWDKQKDVNGISIGIEQEHWGEQDWPDAQVKSCALLCKWLCENRGITLDADHIVSHASVATPKGRKSDPRNYPWTRFWQFVKAGK